MALIDIVSWPRYNKIYMSNVNKNSFNCLKDKIPQNLLDEYIYLSSIYSNSAFLQEISNIQNCSGYSAISPYSYGKDEYVVSFQPESENGALVHALNRAKGSTSDILNYELTEINPKLGRNSIFIALQNDEKTADYNLVPMQKIPEDTRKNLYKDIVELCRYGIAISPLTIYYNEKKDSCKLLNLNDVYVDGFNNIEEKRKYLEQFKSFCGV